MRKRFEQQMSLAFHPIAETRIVKNCRDASQKIALALLEIFKNDQYNEQIFVILEKHISSDSNIGRPGMDLWQIFVMAQFRVGLNLSYDRLHYMVNSDRILRQLLGVESTDFQNTSPIEFSYQNILDNMALLTDEMLKEINDVIVSFGHKQVFKKKEEEAFILKTDSYVVESNVHFPTDYNLLWDCCRKCTDIIGRFTAKHPSVKGWRKLKNWRREFKNACRRVGQITSKGGANKDYRLKEQVKPYIKMARQFEEKLSFAITDFPTMTQSDLRDFAQLIEFKSLLVKHIDLLERRVIKGETIPHEEKMFSVFETYTEWITKGKSRPSVELGKKLCITTDQFHLIVDYQIMESIADSESITSIADRVLLRSRIQAWSFDKGFFSKANKRYLQERDVEQVIMPKKGKLKKEEAAEERSPKFVKYRHKHSAIESNINELEHRGLNRCPDKGYKRFKRYIAIGICAYNLHKIGAEIKRQKIAAEEKIKKAA